MTATSFTVHLRRPHDKQRAFIESPAKRKVIRAGRRGGKTTGIAIYAVDRMLAGRRVLYGTPTQEQVAKFWWEVKRALREPLDAGVLYKNETEHIIEVPGTEQRIRAKTAWNADTLRGDYADELILDEYQLMSEDAWELVGAPMLLDNDGNATFIYTPISLHSKTASKARDPLHAAKMFKRALADESGRWATFHFTSRDNPHISARALEDITKDMTALAVRMEIDAEDVDEVPGALWTPTLIEKTRLTQLPDGVSLKRIAVGVDPPGGVAECGIVAAGLGTDDHGYVLADDSLQGSPNAWGGQVVTTYSTRSADVVAIERNYGGDMVTNTVTGVEGGKNVNIKEVTATRGKIIRAEPIAGRWEKGNIHMLGTFQSLEMEMTTYVAGNKSPNRLDALVWALTELMVEPPAVLERGDNPFYG